MKTHIELFRISLPYGLAVIPKLIKEQEPPQAVRPDEIGEADKRQRRDGAEGELDDGVVGAGVLGVAGGAGDQEVGCGGDDEGEEDEHRPREARRPGAGLVDAHPLEVRSEALELVLRVRHAPHELLV